MPTVHAALVVLLLGLFFPSAPVQAATDDGYVRGYATAMLRQALGDAAPPISVTDGVIQVTAGPGADPDREEIEPPRAPGDEAGDVEIRQRVRPKVRQPARQDEPAHRVPRATVDEERADAARDRHGQQREGAVVRQRRGRERHRPEPEARERAPDRAHRTRPGSQRDAVLGLIERIAPGQAARGTRSWA